MLDQRKCTGVDFRFHVGDTFKYFKYSNCLNIHYLKIYHVAMYLLS